MLAVILSHMSARQARQCRGFKVAVGGSAPSEPTSVSEKPTAPCSDAGGLTVPGDTSATPTALGSSVEKASGRVMIPSHLLAIAVYVSQCRGLSFDVDDAVGGLVLVSAYIIPKIRQSPIIYTRQDRKVPHTPPSQ